ncbi:MAG: hypothetical protein HWE24_09420 [Oceanospirillaceae bacterium]|nr:hypothetical protein [Oceanospirillaceae bacterium]
MMKKNYQKIFILLHYLLFFIFYFMSNLNGWDNLITTLMLYSVGVYFVYGYVFKKEIQVYGVTLPIDDKYARIDIFGCGAFIIISILLSLSGYIEVINLDWSKSTK